MKVQTPSMQWPRVGPLPHSDISLHAPRESWDAASSIPAAALVLWVIIVTITMLFAGFVSAYLIRRTSGDWAPIYSPPLLMLNTVMIVASSAALYQAHRSMSHGQTAAFRFWTLSGISLGIAFIVGQLMVWKQLAAVGLFLPTSPHGSFFYLLSSVHAVHVLGGIAALAYTLGKAIHGAGRSILPARMAATYWHFVTGIWVVLYALLFVWR